MKILLTGTSGQVGGELARILPVLGKVLTPGRAALDLSSPEKIAAYLNDNKPDLIINPAAYTAVDKAESETAIAQAVNADSPAEMAGWCAQHKVPLVHYSTDYVYGGRGDEAFAETAECQPANIYAASKLAGDMAIAASGCPHLIFRTSWVYGVRGKNFLNTMLSLAETRPKLGVVNDQVGAPTSGNFIAATTLAVLAGLRADITQGISARSGVYNLCPGGFVSWHGFAEAIMTLRSQLTNKVSPQVDAIPTVDYPTPAARPLNSRLDCAKLKDTFGLSLSHWETELQTVATERLSA